MGLIQNGYRDAHGCLKFAGGGFSNGAYPAAHHANFHQTGRNRNLFAGEGVTDDKTSVPIGYRPPYTWIMAQKTGGMGVTGRTILGTGGTGNGNLAAGLNAESTLEGTGGIDSAAMGLIMQAIATLAGIGGATVTANGILDAIASITGTGGLSAPLGAIAGGQATLSGQGGVCCSTPRADGFMSADIAPATTVAADVIARAVLDVVIENNLTLADVQKLLLAVAAGDATGLDADPVFKSQDGTKERITGTLSGGTRTITSIDVA